MATTVSLAPIPFWTIIDGDGRVAVNGSIEFLRQANQAQQKPTYAEPTGTLFNQNPLPLNASGASQSDIYFEVDEPYYIVIRDADGTVIRTIEKYTPPSSGGGPIETSTDIDNKLLNGQFRFNNGTVGTPVTIGVNEVCPETWFFETNSGDANDTIDFVKESFGGEPPEQNPTFVFQYNDTVISTGTVRRLYQEVEDANAFSTQVCSFQCEMRADAPVTVELFYEQDFDQANGGDAPNPVVVGSFVVPAGSSFNKYPAANFTVDDTSLKTFGTDTKFRIGVNITFGSPVANLQIVNMLWQDLPNLTEYPYKTALQEESENYFALDDATVLKQKIFTKLGRIEQTALQSSTAFNASNNLTRSGTILVHSESFTPSSDNGTLKVTANLLLSNIDTDTESSVNWRAYGWTQNEPFDTNGPYQDLYPYYGLFIDTIDDSFAATHFDGTAVAIFSGATDRPQNICSMTRLTGEFNYTSDTPFNIEIRAYCGAPVNIPGNTHRVEFNTVQSRVFGDTTSVSSDSLVLFNGDTGSFIEILEFSV